jgi:hypothetical protein
MAQFKVETGTLDTAISKRYEVVMLANNANGDIVSNDNPLPVSLINTNTTLNAPWELQVGREKVDSVTSINIQGYNSAMPSSWCTAWELANSVGNYVYPSTSVAMSFTSVSPESLTMTVSGLDSSYTPKIATVTFAGSNTGTVTTGTNLFYRINKMQITSNTSVGAISATNNGTTYSYVAPGTGQSLASIYTVPAGYTFYLLRVTAYTTNNGNQHCSYRIFTQRISGAITTPQIVLTAPFQQTYSTLRVIPRPYSANTDIQWQLYQSAPAPGSIQLEGILIPNSAS